MFNKMKAWLLMRLEAQDRALFSRLALDPESHAMQRRAWRGVTHLGDAPGPIAAVLVPLAVGHGAVRQGAVLAAWSLLIAFLISQVVKRRAVRTRPDTVREGRSFARVPDRFSFPSGHATASMAIALSYAMVLPTLAIPLIVLALLIGASRVRLAVHFPGDVIAGEAIALFTVLGVAAFFP
jgi:undecaprenyl-diphosphatase